MPTNPAQAPTAERAEDATLDWLARLVDAHERAVLDVEPDVCPPADNATAFARYHAMVRARDALITAVRDALASAETERGATEAENEQLAETACRLAAQRDALYKKLRAAERESATLTERLADQDAGVAIIAAERRRQVEREGYTLDHDDTHVGGELATCGGYYALPDDCRPVREDGTPIWWPFSCCDWKPTPDDRIRELAKAGALIASEIGRLKRAASRAAGSDT